MKSLRERFEEEYAAVSVPADNKDGFRINYIYYAPWHIWELPEKELQKKKGIFTVFCFASLMLFLVIASRPVRFNSSYPVMLSTALTLCVFVLEIPGVLQFARAKYRSTRMTFQNVDRCLRVMPLLRAVLCLFTTAAGVCFIFSKGGTVVDLMVIA